MGSTHALSHVTRMLQRLEVEGYTSVKEVKEFKEELEEV
jgi:hypothetical protein